MDIYLFRLINNLANPDTILGKIGIYTTRYLIYILGVLAIVFVLIVFRKKWERFWIAFKIFLTLCFAYVVNQVIGYIYFRPRPFVDLEAVNELIRKSPFDKSFPSDHTGGAFAIAFAVFLINKKWGSVFLAIALVIGISRVFVGVHYPFDVFAGVLTGLLGAILAKWLIEWYKA